MKKLLFILCITACAARLQAQEIACSPAGCPPGMVCRTKQIKQAEKPNCVASVCVSADAEIKSGRIYPVHYVQDLA